MSIGPEFELIRRIARVLGPSEAAVELGIGDDAAVLTPPAGKLLATVDMLVEGVHFDLGYSSFEDVGYKALAVNLSDIAAMAGTPRYALVSLGLRSGVEAGQVESLYRGIHQLAQRFGVQVVGGNIARSPERLLVDITLLGESAHPLTRSGAKAGDWIVVTGNLGSAAAGLVALKAWGTSAAERFPTLTRAQLRPEPRVPEGHALAPMISALIDISDGCANELHHLAEASEVGVILEEERIPLHEETQRLASELGKDPLEWALQGGEDYELLFCVPPEKLPLVEGVLKDRGRPFHPLGRVTEAREGVRLKDRTSRLHPLEPRGWDHLAKA